MDCLILYFLCLVIMVVSPRDLSVEKKSLFPASLQNISDVLNIGLKKHFCHVQVEVVDCPDLTQEPFTLANKGLNGSPRLVEIGSPAYLLPLVQREKLYDVRDITKLADINPAFVIGAGAGPFNVAKINCEGIMNLNVINGDLDQHSRISKVDTQNGNGIQETLNNSATNFALLANLFMSEGKPGKVLRVHTTKRTGDIDFIASIRTVLAEHFGTNVVGLGGTFLLKEGKAKTHIMPDFSTTPINNDDELNKWLKFYNMSAPLIAVGTLVTSEYDLDLRVQHFHMFSHHGEAGHYHIDTTPDLVEYLGYFNIGEFVYRIDKPNVIQNFGRD